MTTQSNNSLNGPIETLRDGSLKATIWSNIGEKGTFYTVDFSQPVRLDSVQPADLTINGVAATGVTVMSTVIIAESRSPSVA